MLAYVVLSSSLSELAALRANVESLLLGLFVVVLTLAENDSLAAPCTAETSLGLALLLAAQGLAVCLFCSLLQVAVCHS